MTVKDWSESSVRSSPTFWPQTPHVLHRRKPLFFRAIKLEKTQSDNRLSSQTLSRSLSSTMVVSKTAAPPAKAHKASSSSSAKAIGKSSVGVVVGKAGMTILNKVASLKLGAHQDEVERSQLHALTGIAGKSTIANALTKLKNAAWMKVTPKTVIITEEGLAAADEDVMEQMLMDTPQTNEDHRQAVAKTFGNIKPRGMELVDFIGDGRKYGKAKVAVAIGCKMNSTFANILTPLKKAKMIEFDKSHVWLTDEMFPFEPRVSGNAE